MKETTGWMDRKENHMTNKITEGGIESREYNGQKRKNKTKEENVHRKKRNKNK